MPPELSVSSEEVSPNPELRSDFVSSEGGRFERMIIRTLCEPILARVPARVRPNHISLLTHLIAWATVATAVISAQLDRPFKSLALLAAGGGMLLQMIGDCLDGMHARKTNQCSKLGEMMDHWLDANVVPLVTLGITIALDMAPWAIVLVNVTATMVYHAQLVLYHHTGRFIHPEPANGVEGQFGVSIAYGALSIFFFFVHRQALWLDVALGAVAAIGTAVQLRCSWFYYPKLGKNILPHLLFVAVLGSIGLLHLWGAIDRIGFAAMLVFTSFRISGSYVLYTILKRPYRGHDWGIVLFIGLIAATYGLRTFAPELSTFSLPLLPYLASAYMVGRNLLEFAQHYPALSPRATR